MRLKRKTFTSRSKNSTEIYLRKGENNEAVIKGSGKSYLGNNVGCGTRALLAL
jgi:hypothetical protein